MPALYSKHRSTLNTTDEWWEEVVAINQTAVFRMCRGALTYMVKQGKGSIVQRLLHRRLPFAGRRRLLR